MTQRNDITGERGRPFEPLLSGDFGFGRCRQRIHANNTKGPFSNSVRSQERRVGRRQFEKSKGQIEIPGSTKHAPGGRRKALHGQNQGQQRQTSNVNIFMFI